MCEKQGLESFEKTKKTIPILKKTKKNDSNSDSKAWWRVILNLWISEFSGIFSRKCFIYHSLLWKLTKKHDCNRNQFS